MPYILPADRQHYDQHLQDLFKKLVEGDEGILGAHLNYCVSYLMTCLWENNPRYVRANTIRGAVENATEEWYRCNVAGYEETKREENGDI